MTEKKAKYEGPQVHKNPILIRLTDEDFAALKRRAHDDRRSWTACATLMILDALEVGK